MDSWQHEGDLSMQKTGEIVGSCDTSSSSEQSSC